MHVARLGESRMSPNALVKLGLLACLLLVASTAVSGTPGSYVAAVVEYRPHTGWQNNLEALQPLVESAAKSGADIVVLPEYGVSGFQYDGRSSLSEQMEPFPPTPSPGESTLIPCNNSTFNDKPIFQALSCLAQSNGVALVANIADKQPCSTDTAGCPSDGFFLYNTNIAFDTDGSYLAKYHKVHLFGIENKWLNSPPSCQETTFTTSFGVKFGTFICFDLLFTSSLSLVLQTAGVRNIIYTTFWGSLFPSLFSTATQQAWSRMTGTNFIAANIHCQEQFCLDKYRLPASGSGIYSKGAVLTSYVSGKTFQEGDGVVRTASVPIHPSNSNKHHILPREGDNDILMKHDKLDDLIYKPLPIEHQGSISVSKEEEGFTCSLTFSFKIRDFGEKYALGVFYGKKSYGLAGYCVLLRCSATTCGEPVTKASSVFEEIELTGTFPNGTRVFPIIIGNEFSLMDPKHSQIHGHNLTMRKINEPLLAVSMWARIETDIPKSQDVTSVMVNHMPVQVTDEDCNAPSVETNHLQSK